MSRSQKRNTKLVDMVSCRFGRLFVVARAKAPSHVSNQGRAYWECICDCGNATTVSGRDLRGARTQSCGCLHTEISSITATRHGHAKPGLHTRTYNTWQAMRRRCLQENEDRYAEYGGRGITICARWDSFEAFLEDMGERPDGMTLDRYPDVNGNYEPGNCRWATVKEQNENKRNSLAYEFNGKRLSLKDWAKTTGIDYATLRERIRNLGWTVERALTEPAGIRAQPKSTPMVIEIDGISRCASAWARIWGLPPHVVRKRAKSGWPANLLCLPIGSVPRLKTVLLNKVARDANI